MLATRNSDSSSRVAEEDRPDLVSSRLRRSTRAAIARCDGADDSSEGLVLLITGDDTTLAASAIEPNNRNEAMKDDEAGWSAAEAKDIARITKPMSRSS